MLKIWLSTVTALWPYMGAGRGPAWRQEEAPATSSSVLAVKVKVSASWCSPPVTRYTCTSVHSQYMLVINDVKVGRFPTILLSVLTKCPHAWLFLPWSRLGRSARNPSSL